ncbi:hypothetical protein Tco_0481265 [Tanacetum coccineum]
MYSYNYFNLDKLRWLAKTLKKGSPFAPDNNEPPLRSYQLWKKTFYEETHKTDDMTGLPKSQPNKTYEEDLESEIVMVKIPRCMAWLGSTNAYDEPIGSLVLNGYDQKSFVVGAWGRSYHNLTHNIHQKAWIPFLARIPLFFHLVKNFTISNYVTRATKDVKVFESRFPVIDDVIQCLFMSMDDERPILGVTCSCSSFSPKEEWKF